MFSYLAHRRACKAKQEERRQRIERLGPVYHAPLSAADKEILHKSVAELISEVQSGALSPSAILVAYGKQALKAQAATNCLTEIFIDKAEGWAKNCNISGPLAGIPVSLKDENGVEGLDQSIGFSAWVNKPVTKDCALVRLLHDAGAIPFVKTNVPTTLLSFECTNDVFGRTTNPHNKAYTPGGSSGGEAALLAYGGSCAGMGSDGAGSLRVPSHYSGVFTVRPSFARFPRTGSPNKVNPGQEGVAVSTAPMARTLDDLETLWRGIMTMKPWEYDYNVLPIPWREVDLSATKNLRFGIMWDDGVVAPSPACRRALQTVVSTLQNNGYEVIDVHPPSPYDGLKIAAQLMTADATKAITRVMRTGETNDPGVREMKAMFCTPRLFKKLYAWYLRYIRRDEQYAGLVEIWSQKTIPEYLTLVSQREAYREKWFRFLQENQLDFVLTVPNALPAVPHGGMKEGFKSCTYTFLFNLLDYTAGVLPVTHVDASRDTLPASFKTRNTIEAGAYRMYDAQKMHGLPVGVEIVGRRLQEENVLECMKIINRLLKQEGKAYVPMNNTN